MKNDEHRLGRKTIAALIGLLKDWSRADIRKMLFEHELNERFQEVSKLDALGYVFYPMVDDAEIQRYAKMYDNPYYSTPDGFSIDRDKEVRNTIELIEHIVQEFPSRYGGEDRIEVLRKSLRSDGLDLDDEGRVVRFLSQAVDPGKEQGLLESRLIKAGFTLAHEHFDEAVSSAEIGNWKAANGQIRTFLEALCDAIAERLHEGGEEAPKGGDARNLMADRGFLSKEESNLLKAFFTVLHGAGAHPGTSSEDDCHRRRLMAVALANYYLDHFDEWPKQARA